ncbi:hypothetical protein [uncultured Polaribacter sp.]|uniref:hypothetical protein n=1 Tax=uncultured Polaribacter sp. TaxID=174711 RepID=UPI002628AE71|nr:hypothetical protein [uncultured Polaribacter sp.]
MIKKYNFTYALLPLIFLMFQACTNHTPKLQIISNTFEENTPSSHGLQKIVASLDTLGVTINQKSNANDEATDYYLLLGKSSEENEATELLQELNLSLPNEKEALRIKKTTFKGKPALVLCGADEVGLMYAALDVAKRISWSKNPENLFEYVKEASETPDVKERAVSAGTFHRRYFEQKLHDVKYWETYFDMMAENRLNQFLLIFGYKNNQMKEPNFMAPAYPNFFNVEGYPYVKIQNVTEEQQKQNTASLKKIIEMAHARGIEFGVGLWDQIERDPRYKAMVSAGSAIPSDLPDNIIWGLTQENLIPYTKLAMRKFFRNFPEIDLVQFRMHWEAGITGDVALEFWKEIFNMLKEENPNIKIEARAKDVPDETLYDGVATGADFRVATKHWMEQMGMPFHPTHINKDNQFDRRHGYADMLRYPKKYGFKWRVWSGGTTRLFLWGAPDWVKTFSEGSHLYDAVGFEFNEPLYFKMNGSKHDAEVTDLLNPDYRYYDYEFERYWHYYQVMGRVSYNPETTSDIWEMEFNKRFGKEAGQAIMTSLHKASKILPRIVAASYLYPRFASPQGWPELQRMEDLKHFALNSKPSDIQQFASPKEEAEFILEKKPSFRILPSETSKWFSNISKDILNDVENAEKTIGAYDSNEFISTKTDLKMLAYLAQYHSQRLLAAVNYNLYHKTGDLVAFDKALYYESNAVNAYGKMVESAGNVYNQQLDFGSNKSLFPGHWSKEHKRLENELQSLKQVRAEINDSTFEKDLIVHIPKTKIEVDSTLTVETTLKLKQGVSDSQIMYSLNGEDYKGITMKHIGNNIYTQEIPFSKSDSQITYYFNITDKLNANIKYPKTGSENPFKVLITDDNEAPIVELQRIKNAPINKALKVEALVTDASGVQDVILRFRRVNQFEDYQSLEMTKIGTSDIFEGIIPSDFFDGKYDVMYFVEVIDTKGNGKIYPDLEKEAPYVIVHLNR